MHEIDGEPLGPSVDPRFEVEPRLSRRHLLKGGLASLTASTGLLASARSHALPSAGLSATDETYWDNIAEQFLIKPDVTYLNTGTRGPSPLSVYEAQVNSIRQVNEDRLGYVKSTLTAEYKAAVRQKLADFLGCKVNELAITNNTTEGMAIGTNGLDMKPRDEIVYTNHDHASGGQPVNLRCAREGMRPVMVDLSHPKYHPPERPDDLVKAIEAAITPRTRLISFCHVNYTDGCVMPVKEICELARSKGILTLVDGAHPPGMLNMNIRELGCDMYAGACHKWMLAGMLTGFFYVREELQGRIWPSVYSGPVLGKNMYGGRDDAERGRTAQRYETHGSTNYASLVSIDAAIDFHNAIGPQAIEDRDRYLAAHARQSLQAMDGVEVFVSRDPRLSAGLVAFRVRGIEPKQLTTMLWERHSIYQREVTHKDINWDVNRLSLHNMAKKSQVDRTLDAIAEIAKNNRA